MKRSASQNSHRKTLILILILFSSIALIAIFFGVGKHQQKVKPQDIKINGAYLTPPKQISDFNLITKNNTQFTKANLKGKWTFMFFGFTNCAVVCPTTMTELNKMYQILVRELPSTELPQVVMVTVDPERDTKKRVNEYVQAFNPQFIGVSGQMDDLVSLQKQLHILAIKVQGKGGGKNNYYYDHSADVLLFNPEGEVQAYLSYPHNSEQMAKEYQMIKRYYS